MRLNKRLGLGIAATALLAMSMLTGSFDTVTAQVLKATVKPLKIRDIVGKDTVRVGDVETYRAIVNEPRDVEYRWSTGDRSAFGNPVVHRFTRPGTFKVIVTARNVVSTAKDSLTITVLGSEPSIVAGGATTEDLEMPAESAKPAAPTVPTSTSTDRSAPPAAPALTKVSPRETSRNEVGFKGKERVSADATGFTWVVATYFQRPSAVALANSYRASGYRSGVITDRKGLGSQVYRVTLGKFDTEASALRARRHLIKAGHRNVLLLELGRTG